jgi:hypothetical protein
MEKDGKVLTEFERNRANGKRLVSPELAAVQKTLKAKLKELLHAEPSKIPGLTLELQRLRVAAMMITEMDEGVADPATYKELNLLNRMITNADLEGDAARVESEADIASATKLLTERGISRQSAQRITRVLTAAQSVPMVDAYEEPDELDPEQLPPADDADPQLARRTG